MIVFYLALRSFKLSPYSLKINYSSSSPPWCGSFLTIPIPPLLSPCVKPPFVAEPLLSLPLNNVKVSISTNYIVGLLYFFI
jgi:hypothetical protein